MTAELPTVLFIVCMALADIPVAVLLWFMWRNLSWDGGATGELTRAIFVLSIAKFFFFGSQLATVILGAFGYGYAARTPIIFMVDGSLFILMLANWYAFWVIYKLQGHVRL